MLLCFTDLDGTLLNHDDYCYDAAVPVIQQLQAAGIPVIPTTSKTRAEVVDLRAALGLKDPFITENGSGIFLEENDERFRFSDSSESGNQRRFVPTGGRITLGVTYAEARAGLRSLSTQIGEELRGFGDLSTSELGALTGLPPEDLRRACDRQFSEPFVKPQTDLEQLEAIAHTQGFKILVGNRFCHLLGQGAGKGKAVLRLKQAWEATTGAAVTTLGLGDSPNDLSMLEAVDIAVVVPGIKGPNPGLVPQIAQRGWRVAPEPGCRGWAEAVGAIAADHC